AASPARGRRQRQRPEKRLKVGRDFAVNADTGSRARMNELKMRGMKRDASNAPLRRLCRVILSVADHRMVNRRKLHADLILQSRHQRDSDQRSGPKRAFHGIPEFSTSPGGVLLRGTP